MKSCSARQMIHVVTLCLEGEMRVCVCKRERERERGKEIYFVFFSPQAFNLLFLNLPPLPVRSLFFSCRALSCPRFESE